MTRTEARVKKQRVININTIIFTAEYNPRVPGVNATIKRHEHILQYNTVLKELLPTNSFIVTNNREKNLRVGCTRRSIQHKSGSFKSNRARLQEIWT